MTPRTGPRRGKVRPRAEETKRLRVAAEAARIMAEEGVRDFQMTKRKAAERLNLTDHHHLPSNEEIQLALAEHLQLFHGPKLQQNTRHLREVAAEAMRFLAPFEPRLVGPVLNGTITSTSEVQLHVSADSPEEIGMFLGEHRIPFELGDRRARFGGDRYETISTFRFSADGAMVELSVFDRRTVREPPLDPIDGRPMKRAGLKEVETLLGQ